MSAGLLAVHAHPDDETLATGGLLAAWAASGGAVTVVTCTRGERGEVIGPDPARLEGDGPALAAHRERELAEALTALGSQDHPVRGVFLDTLPRVDGESPVDGAQRYRDSGMAWAGAGLAGRLADLPPDAFVAVPIDEAAARLAGLIRRMRPDVVVTYEPDGGYGHPDHVRAHQVTMRALELAADPSASPGPAHVVGAVLWAAVATGVLRAAYRALAGLPVASDRGPAPVLAAPDASGPLPSVAVPAGVLDLVVDVEPVLDRVTSALRAHRTQVQAVAVLPGGVSLDVDESERPVGDVRLVGSYALSNDVLAPLLSHESYRFAPGRRATDVAWPDAVTPVA